MTTVEAIGRALTRARKLAGLSQKRVAAAAGVHPMALSKIERGVHADAGVVTLEKMCDAILTESGFEVELTLPVLLAMAYGILEREALGNRCRRSR